MKLTKSQKKILKSIPNKKIRLEQKLQFKIQNRFFSRKPIFFVDGKLETDNPFHIQFLSQHPMCEKESAKSQKFVMTPKGLVPMSDEISNMIDKGEFKTWYSTSAEEVNKKFDELANKFIPNEKGNEIISEEKELFLNNQFLQDFLDKCNNLKILQNFKTKCVKCQNYEYATKFRQKVWDILVTLSTEKLIELVQDGTIELIDMSRAMGMGHKKGESANYESSKPRSIDPITPFTPDQIETVIDWMNTWEQLKDTVIPIRFKEDFANKL